MTLVLPDGVGKCPRCSGPVKFLALASVSGHDIEGWTDGWVNSAHPTGGRGWVRCPHCDAVMPDAEMEAGRKETIRYGDPGYADARNVAAPSPEQLQALLTERLARAGEGGDEKRTRLELWWAMNDARRRDFPSTQAQTPEEEQNLRRLGELLGAFGPRLSILEEEGCLKVEILRELGHFAAAKAVLRRARAQIDHLEALVDAGDRVVKRGGAVACPPWDGYPMEIAQDMQAALKLKGDGQAAMRVARRFESGDGVPQDREAAGPWRERARRAAHSEELTREGIAALGQGDMYFGAAMRALVPAARGGSPEAQQALGLGAAFPDACRHGIAFLGGRGTPEAIPLFASYVETAREFAAALPDPSQRAGLRELVEALRDALLAILRRESGHLGESARACGALADFTELDPAVSFSAVRLLASPVA